MVTAGIIYGLKVQDDRRRKPRPPGLPPRATPAQEPLTLQQIRAVERGRGRRARAPSQIPWRGWKDVFVRTYDEIQNDRLLALAAGVAFYSLVALFPAIAAGVSSYALFANVATIGKHLSIVGEPRPPGGRDLPHRGQERWQAHLRLSPGARHRAVERQCGHEGDLRRTQHHLRRRRETRPHLAQRGLAILYRLRHCRSRGGDRAGGGVSAVSGRIRPQQLRPSDRRILALAADVRLDHSRAVGALPLWAEPPAGEVALAQRRQRLRRARLARGLFAVFLVPRQFCQLQRHLRRARRGRRLDDVDVAFDHRGAG